MVTLQIINKTAARGSRNISNLSNIHLKESEVKNLVETREEVDPAILIGEVKIESGRKENGRC